MARERISAAADGLLAVLAGIIAPSLAIQGLDSVAAAVGVSARVARHPLAQEVVRIATMGVLFAAYARRFRATVAAAASR